jgi:hypothetical protein
MTNASPALSTVSSGARTARRAIPTMSTISATVAPSVQVIRLESRSYCSIRAPSAPVAPTT